MNIRMTQNELRRSGLKRQSELFSTPDKIENLITPGLQERSQSCRNGVSKSVILNTRQERLDDFAPLWRICFLLDASR